MTNTRNTNARQLEDCPNWISTSPKSFKNSIPRETCFPIYVEEVSVETLLFVRNMKYLCRPITLNNWNQLAKPFNGDISILKRLSRLAFDGDKPCPVLICHIDDYTNLGHKNILVKNWELDSLIIIIDK